MKTELHTWEGTRIGYEFGWHFRIDCCGFFVASHQSFDTKEDAENFANNLINKFVDVTQPPALKNNL